VSWWFILFSISPIKKALTPEFGYNAFMRSFLASAVVTAGLLAPLCLYAQHRGAPHSSFSRSAGNFRSYSVASRPRPGPRPGPRPASSVNSSASFRRFSLPPVRGTSLINFGESSCLLNPSYAGSFYCRQFFPGRRGFGVEPVYPFWLPSPGYETDQSAPPAVEPEQDNPLAAQVGNLASEVELMREDQARRDSRGAPPAETPAAAEEKPPTTLLVYRDGHQLEVQDYAILGKTLWVFSAQTTRRVPLADLDLTATQRVNGDRGVDFATPDPQ